MYVSPKHFLGYHSGNPFGTLLVYGLSRRESVSGLWRTKLCLFNLLILVLSVCGGSTSVVVHESVGLLSSWLPQWVVVEPTISLHMWGKEMRQLNIKQEIQPNSWKVPKVWNSFFEIWRNCIISVFQHNVGDTVCRRWSIWWAVSTAETFPETQ